MSFVNFCSTLLSFVSAQTIAPEEIGMFGFTGTSIGNFFAGILQAVCSLFYVVCKWFLAVVDFLQYFIQKLIGLDYWLKDGRKTFEGATDNDLLFSFLYNDTVQRVFRAMIAVFFLLLIVFTIFAIVKQEWEFATGGFEGKTGNSKTAIIRDSMKAIGLVIIFPIILMLGIISSNAILASLVNALNLDMKQTFGSTLFAISSQSANRHRIYADNGMRSPVSQQVTFYVRNSDGKVLEYSNGSLEPGSHTEYFTDYRDYINAIYNESGSQPVTECTVNSIFEFVNPRMEKSFDGFACGIKFDGKYKYFMVKCDSSQRFAMYNYLTKILEAKVITSSESANRTNGLVDDASEEICKKIKKGKGFDNTASDGFIHDLDISDIGNCALIDACYNTWSYPSVYMTKKSFTSAQSYGIVQSDLLEDYNLSGVSSAKMVYNSGVVNGYFDGGQFGVVQKQAEYYVMADVVDFMNDNGLKMYMIDATSTMIDWEYEDENGNSYSPDSKWVAYDETKPAGAKVTIRNKNGEDADDDNMPNVLPFIVSYSDECGDHDVGNVLYLAHEGASNELEGSVYIMCFKITDGTSSKYIPLVNGEKYVDKLTGISATFKSDYYAKNYKGVVIAKGIFETNSTNAMFGEPTYIKTSLDGANLNWTWDSADLFGIQDKNGHALTTAISNLSDEPYYYHVVNNGTLNQYIDSATSTPTAYTFNGFRDTTYGLISPYMDGATETQYFELIDRATNNPISFNEVIVQSLEIRLTSRYAYYANQTVDISGNTKGYLFCTTDGRYLIVELNTSNGRIRVRGIESSGEFSANGSKIGTTINSLTTIYELYAKFDSGYKLNGVNTSSAVRVATLTPNYFEYFKTSGTISTYQTIDPVSLKITNTAGTVDYYEKTTQLNVNFNTKSDSLVSFDGEKIVFAAGSGSASNVRATNFYKLYLFNYMTGAVGSSALSYDLYEYDYTANSGNGESGLLKDAGGASISANVEELNKIVDKENILDIVIDGDFTWDKLDTSIGLYNGKNYIATAYKEKHKEFEAGSVGDKSIKAVTNRILYNYKEYYNIATQNRYSSQANLDTYYETIFDSVVIAFYRDNASSSLSTMVCIDYNLNLFGGWRFKAVIGTIQNITNDVAGFFDLAGGISFDYFFDGDIDGTVNGDVEFATFFVPSKVAYWIILIASALIIKVLGTALWGVIKRFYEITLYFIAMPAVASTIPLDGGKRFGSSIQTPLISKVLSTYGVILGINVFFILLAPVEQISKTVFTAEDIATSGMYFLQHLPIPAWLLNKYVYILFILVAFTMIDALPKTLSQLIGADDVVAQGEATKGAVQKTMKEAGDTISGRSAISAVKNVGGAIAGAVPGGALLGKAAQGAGKIAGSFFKKGDGSGKGNARGDGEGDGDQEMPGEGGPEGQEGEVDGQMENGGDQDGADGEGLARENGDPMEMNPLDAVTDGMNEGMDAADGALEAIPGADGFADSLDDIESVGLGEFGASLGDIDSVAGGLGGVGAEFAGSLSNIETVASTSTQMASQMTGSAMSMMGQTSPQQLVNGLSGAAMPGGMQVPGAGGEFAGSLADVENVASAGDLTANLGNMAQGVGDASSGIQGAMDMAGGVADGAGALGSTLEGVGGVAELAGDATGAGAPVGMIIGAVADTAGAAIEIGAEATEAAIDVGSKVVEATNEAVQGAVETTSQVVEATSEGIANVGNAIGSLGEGVEKAATGAIENGIGNKPDETDSFVPSITDVQDVAEQIAGDSSAQQLVAENVASSVEQNPAVVKATENVAEKQTAKDNADSAVKEAEAKFENALENYNGVKQEFGDQTKLALQDEGVKAARDEMLDKADARWDKEKELGEANQDVADKRNDVVDTANKLGSAEADFNNSVQNMRSLDNKMSDQTELALQDEEVLAARDDMWAKAEHKKETEAELHKAEEDTQAAKEKLEGAEATRDEKAAFKEETAADLERAEGATQEAKGKLEDAEAERDKKVSNQEKTAADLEKAQSATSSAEAALAEAQASGDESKIASAQAKVDNARANEDAKRQANEEAQAEVNAAQADVDSAQSEYDSAAQYESEIREVNDVATQEFNDAQAAVDSAQADVDSAEQHESEVREAHEQAVQEHKEAIENYNEKRTAFLEGAKERGEVDDIVTNDQRKVAIDDVMKKQDIANDRRADHEKAKDAYNESVEHRNEVREERDQAVADHEAAIDDYKGKREDFLKQAEADGKIDHYVTPDEYEGAIDNVMSSQQELNDRKTDAAKAGLDLDNAKANLENAKQQAAIQGVLASGGDAGLKFGGGSQVQGVPGGQGGQPGAQSLNGLSDADIQRIVDLVLAQLNGRAAGGPAIAPAEDGGKLGIGLVPGDGSAGFMNGMVTVQKDPEALQAAQDDLDEKTELHNAAVETKNNALGELNAAEADFAAKDQTVAEEEAKLNQDADDYNAAAQERENADNELAESRETLGKEQGTLDQLEGELGEITGEHDKAVSNVADEAKNVKGAETELQSKERVAAKADKEAERADTSLTKAQDEQSRAQQQFDDISAEYDEKKKAHDDVVAAHQEHIGQVNEQEAISINAHNEWATANGKLEAKTDEVADAQAVVDRHNERGSELLREKADIVTDIGDMQSKKEHNKREITSLTAGLADDKEKQKSLVSEWARKHDASNDSRKDLEAATEARKQAQEKLNGENGSEAVYKEKHARRKEIEQARDNLVKQLDYDGKKNETSSERELREKNNQRIEEQLKNFTLKDGSTVNLETEINTARAEEKAAKQQRNADRKDLLSKTADEAKAGVKHAANLVSEEATNIAISKNQFDIKRKENKITALGSENEQLDTRIAKRLEEKDDVDQRIAANDELKSGAEAHLGKLQKEQADLAVDEAKKRTTRDQEAGKYDQMLKDDKELASKEKTTLKEFTTVSKKKTDASIKLERTKAKTESAKKNASEKHEAAEKAHGDVATAENNLEEAKAKHQGAVEIEQGLKKQMDDKQDQVDAQRGVVQQAQDDVDQKETNSIKARQKEDAALQKVEDQMTVVEEATEARDQAEQNVHDKQDAFVDAVRAERSAKQAQDNAQDVYDAEKANTEEVEGRVPASVGVVAGGSQFDGSVADIDAVAGGRGEFDGSVADIDAVADSGVAARRPAESSSTAAFDSSMNDIDAIADASGEVMTPDGEQSNDKKSKIARTIFNAIGAAGTVIGTLAGGPIVGLLIHKTAKNIKKVAPGIVQKFKDQHGEFKKADGWGKAAIISKMAMKGAAVAAGGVLAAQALTFAAPALGVLGAITGSVGVPLWAIGAAGLTGIASKKMSQARDNGTSYVNTNKPRVVKAGAGAGVADQFTQVGADGSQTTVKAPKASVDESTARANFKAHNAILRKSKSARKAAETEAAVADEIFESSQADYDAVMGDENSSEQDRADVTKALAEARANKVEKAGLLKQARDKENADRAVVTKDKQDIENSMTPQRKAARREQIASTILSGVGAVGTIAGTIAGGPIVGLLIHKASKNVRKAAPGVMRSIAQKHGEFKKADGWGKAEILSGMVMKGAAVAAGGALAAQALTFAAPALGVVNAITSSVGAPLWAIGLAGLTGVASKKLANARDNGQSYVNDGNRRVVAATGSGAAGAGVSGVIRKKAAGAYRVTGTQRPTFASANTGDMIGVRGSERRSTGAYISNAAAGFRLSNDQIAEVAKNEFNANALNDTDYVDNKANAKANVIRNRVNSKIGRLVTAEVLTSYGESLGAKGNAANKKQAAVRSLFTKSMRRTAILSTLSDDQKAQFEGLSDDAVDAKLKDYKVESGFDTRGQLLLSVQHGNKVAVVDQKTTDALTSKMLSSKHIGDARINTAIDKVGATSNVEKALAGNLALGVDYNTQDASTTTSMTALSVYRKAGQDEDIFNEAALRHIENSGKDSALYQRFAEEFNISENTDLKNPETRGRVLEQIGRFAKMDNKNVINSMEGTSVAQEFSSVVREKAAAGEFKITSWDLADEETKSNFTSKISANIDGLARNSIMNGAGTSTQNRILANTATNVMRAYGNADPATRSIQNTAFANSISDADIQRIAEVVLRALTGKDNAAQLNDGDRALLGFTQTVNGGSMNGVSVQNSPNFVNGFRDDAARIAAFESLPEETIAQAVEENGRSELYAQVATQDPSIAISPAELAKHQAAYFAIMQSGESKRAIANLYRGFAGRRGLDTKIANASDENLEAFFKVSKKASSIITEDMKEAGFDFAAVANPNYTERYSRTADEEALELQVSAEAVSADSKVLYHAFANSGIDGKSGITNAMFAEYAGIADKSSDGYIATVTSMTGFNWNAANAKGYSNDDLVMAYNKAKLLGEKAPGKVSLDDLAPYLESNDENDTKVLQAMESMPNATRSKLFASGKNFSQVAEGLGGKLTDEQKAELVDSAASSGFVGLSKAEQDATLVSMARKDSAILDSVRKERDGSLPEMSQGMAGFYGKVAGLGSLNSEKLTKLGRNIKAGVPMGGAKLTEAEQGDALAFLASIKEVNAASAHKMTGMESLQALLSHGEIAAAGLSKQDEITDADILKYLGSEAGKKDNQRLVSNASDMTFFEMKERQSGASSRDVYESIKAKNAENSAIDSTIATQGDLIDTSSLREHIEKSNQTDAINYVADTYAASASVLNDNEKEKLESDAAYGVIGASAIKKITSGKGYAASLAAAQNEALLDEFNTNSLFSDYVKKTKSSKPYQDAKLDENFNEAAFVVSSVEKMSEGDAQRTGFISRFKSKTERAFVIQEATKDDALLKLDVDDAAAKAVGTETRTRLALGMGSRTVAYADDIRSKSAIYRKASDAYRSKTGQGLDSDATDDKTRNNYLASDEFMRNLTPAEQDEVVRSRRRIDLSYATSITKDEAKAKSLVDSTVTSGKSIDTALMESGYIEGADKLRAMSRNALNKQVYARVDASEFERIYRESRRDNNGADIQEFAKAKRDFIKKASPQEITQITNENAVSSVERDGFNSRKNIIRQAIRNDDKSEILTNTYRNSTFANDEKILGDLINSISDTKRRSALAMQYSRALGNPKKVQALKNDLSNEEISKYVSSNEVVKDHLVEIAATNPVLALDKKTQETRKTETVLETRSLHAAVGKELFAAEFKGNKEGARKVVVDSVKDKTSVNYNAELAKLLNSASATDRARGEKIVERNHEVLKSRVIEQRYFKKNESGKYEVNTAHVSAADFARAVRMAEKQSNFKTSLNAQMTRVFDVRRIVPDSERANFFKSDDARKVASAQTMEHKARPIGVKQAFDNFAKEGNVGVGIRSNGVVFKQTKQMPERSPAYANWNKYIDSRIATVNNGVGNRESRAAEVARLKAMKIDTKLPANYASMTKAQKAEYDKRQTANKTRAIEAGNFNAVYSQAKVQPSRNASRQNFAKTNASYQAGTYSMTALSNADRKTERVRVAHETERIRTVENIRRYNETKPMRNNNFEFGSNFAAFARSYFSTRTAGSIDRNAMKQFLDKYRGQLDKNGNKIGDNSKFSELSQKQQAELRAIRTALFEKQLELERRRATAKVIIDRREERSSMLQRVGMSTPVVRYRNGAERFTTMQSAVNTRIPANRPGMLEYPAGGPGGPHGPHHHRMHPSRIPPDVLRRRILQQRKLIQMIEEFNRNFKGSSAEYSRQVKQIADTEIKRVMNKKKSEFTRNLKSIAKRIESQNSSDSISTTATAGAAKKAGKAFDVKEEARIREIARQEIRKNRPKR